jgi:hypothetical protein
MIDLESLRALRTASPDYEETEALKAEFLKLRSERRPFFLTGQELDRVFHWKLRSQCRRQLAKRSKTPDDVYRAVTEAALRLAAPIWSTRSPSGSAYSSHYPESAYLSPRRSWRLPPLSTTA